MSSLEPGIKVKHVTADGAILVGNGKLYGLSIKATAANAEAIFYDSLSAAGTIIEEMGVAVDNDSQHITLSRPLDVTLGVYVDVTNCVATGYYMDGAYA